MQEKTLSVFVDESGVLKHPDNSSRFYILAFVFHDQADAISEIESELVANWRNAGVERMCFHAGPIIRQTDEFQILSWATRNKIFSAMMGFARKAKFGYRCLCVDKAYVNSSEQIVTELEAQFGEFWAAHPELKAYDKIKVYYDCGQQTITNLLHRIFSPGFLPPVEFAQGVRPERYRMFQLADMICSLELINQKFEHGLPMSNSEYHFFGGPRNFKRVTMRRIKAKEL